MGLSPEWEKLFGPVPGSGPASDSGAQMTLASAATPGGGGGGGDGLDVQHGPWTTAAGVSGELTGATNAAVTRLETSHEGVVATLEGFMLPAILGEVRTSWKERLEDVRAECTRMEASLRTAGKEFGEVDHRVKGGFDGVHPGKEQ
ncbi:hypothetical protein [Streptomyces sp. NBC_00503]|uniref:hypothetical protein n=1 Tax=Streptomyces sp. NBC_00503 TaxID=2903659 RepID=UPI002E813B6D|nr:hypothetical protein [Streptomyces sp. NBC_00503]WUD83338.1 hypothetical protein OG490_23845 [Streptomyces sp. NBC_00503]